MFFFPFYAHVFFLLNSQTPIQLPYATCVIVWSLFFPFFIPVVRSGRSSHAVHFGGLSVGEQEWRISCGMQSIMKKENKEINVNWKNSVYGSTAIHYACQLGHDKIFALLLAHPDIDVNQKTNHGFTPFLLACYDGNTSCVQLLLKDARVKVNEPNNDGYTPLWNAARYGYPEVIKWWIASGREMDLGQPGNKKTDAIGVAMETRETEVVSLLERFERNPTQTRSEVRKELGWFGEEAELFALIIFLSDGLLEIRENNMAGAARFFRMAKDLPLELQMVLCHRVVGSTGENIPGEQSELAFKELARRILQ